jgi:DNA polymerase-3 subunit delta
VVGDAATFAVDETVDALALGDAASFDRGFRRLLASGTPGFVVGSAAQRHFAFLHRARAALDRGASARDIVERARPPVFFQRKQKVERQIERWPLARIERVLGHLEQAMVDSRLRGSITDEVVGEALTMVASVAAGLRRS